MTKVIIIELYLFVSTHMNLHHVILRKLLLRHSYMVQWMDMCSIPRSFQNNMVLLEFRQFSKRNLWQTRSMSIWVWKVIHVSSSLLLYYMRYCVILVNFFRSNIVQYPFYIMHTNLLRHCIRHRHCIIRVYIWQQAHIRHPILHPPKQAMWRLDYNSDTLKQLQD